ncbi:MAG TPA: DUF374 domain-containing protein [Caulobacteraceae bacterium]|nr:DUF374 domain-containing protein [Caulobacteraceae bacterium]
MKRFLRLAPVQAALAVALWAYLSLVGATMRWRVEAPGYEDELAKPEGGMVFFWHGRIALGVVARRAMRGREMRAMISLSPDGEFIAKAAAMLGVPAIRGSAARRAGHLGKGGAKAFVEALAFIAAGGGVFVTPDGPRGPAEVMQAGPVAMAARSGTRVYLTGLAARPVIRLRSWDRTRLPLPFGRGVAVVDGPLRTPQHADRQTIERVRTDWEARLKALDARAEALLAAAA